MVPVASALSRMRRVLTLDVVLDGWWVIGRVKFPPIKVRPSASGRTEVAPETEMPNDVVGSRVPSLPRRRTPVLPTRRKRPEESCAAAVLMGVPTAGAKAVTTDPVGTAMETVAGDEVVEPLALVMTTR